MATVTINGTALKYFERPNSPQESYSGDAFKAKRIFDVPYLYRWIFIKYMLGDAILSTDGKKIIRTLPDQYYVYLAPAQPYSMGESFMVATSLEGIENLGQQKSVLVPQAGTALEVASYDFARITIGYESVTYRVKSDIAMGFNTEYNLQRYTTSFRQPSAEFLTLPFGAFKWVEIDPLTQKTKIDKKTGAPAGIRVTGSNGKILPATEIILINHRVPGVPKALKTHIGCVNSKDWLELDVKKGQLLLTNVELKPFKWFGNRRLFDITYKLKYLDPDPIGTKNYPLQPRGHNWFLQFFPVDTTTNIANNNIDSLLQGKQEYKLISSDGTLTGKKVYEEKDFADLFKDFETVSGMN